MEKESFEVSNVPAKPSLILPASILWIRCELLAAVSVPKPAVVLLATTMMNWPSDSVRKTPNAFFYKLPLSQYPLTTIEQ